MSVHHKITKHLEKQQHIGDEFNKLEMERERAIAQAVQKCEQGEPFSTDAINAVTDEMNKLAKQGGTPTRKRVTVDMVKAYVEQK